MKLQRPGWRGVLAGALLTCGAWSAGAQEAFSYTLAQYTCDGGARVEVRYARYGAGGPRFAVVSYSGGVFGLAEAASASGERYAGLFGPKVDDHGLEWWEAKGVGTLSKFTGTDTRETKPLLRNCRTR
ncbi:MliC family protein [Deinococcus maricopensis]|uniref:C-type lysozyme inhibitor domain-containing protein n=1 Tax=Deinococcus maricopensis (strain DSM 21211 / LMG 22137 / NRRL B-23946 / LB-34) TaxID=709986 RepID=E8U5R1_DEIML|nr:MliC family protein [Deinococcus maricopensis]ADV66400.1 Protein of unknown function DUF2091, periplasmic [Deinococcus maricopensis DSM 21211]